MQAWGLIVLLVSKAAGHCLNADALAERGNSSSGVLNDQRALAEIAEMIRTSHLMHNGIVNLHRGMFSEPLDFNDMCCSNKIAMLSGDYLLAKSYSKLAVLKNQQVRALKILVVSHNLFYDTFLISNTVNIYLLIIFVGTYLRGWGGTIKSRPRLEIAGARDTPPSRSFPKDRRIAFVGRRVLRCLVSKYTGFSPLPHIKSHRATVDWQPTLVIFVAVVHLHRPLVSRWQ